MNQEKEGKETCTRNSVVKIEAEWTIICAS